MSVPSSGDIGRPPAIPGHDLLTTLAGGASSTVYRALNPATGEQVAVKVLAGRLATDGDRLRFQREIEAMKQLAGHPYIVELLDSGFTADHRPFLVMPVYGNGTWASLVDSNGPLGWQQLLDFGVKVAGALESVHRSGFVHRDIKPANVFRNDDGDPILADFGVSSFIAPGLDGPATVGIAATPIFAAPEVLNGERPSTVSDIYSLGTVFFGLVEGRPAFAHQSVDLVIRDVTAATPSPAVDAEVPAPLRALIEAMMAKRPIARPPTALDVARRLVSMQLDHGLPPSSILVLEEDGITDYTDHTHHRAGELRPGHPPDRAGRTMGATSLDDTRLSPEPTENARTREPTTDPTPGSTTDRSIQVQDTVTVEPIRPPTRPLPHRPTGPDPVERMAAGRPGMAGPVAFGVGALIFFVAFWVVTGRSPGADDDADEVAAGTTPVLQEVGRWPAHDSLVGAVDWSSDGSRLATGGRDNLVRVWEVDEDGGLDPADELEVGDWVLDVAWADDDGRLAIARTDGLVTIWQVDNGSAGDIAAIAGSVEAVDWEPGGHRLATVGGDGSLTVWSLNGSEAVIDVELEQQSDGLLAVAWSPNGDTLATGGKDGRATIWPLAPGPDPLVLEHDDWVRDLAWSPTGSLLATATGDGAVQVWDPGTGDRLEQIRVAADPIAGLEWSTLSPLLLIGTDTGHLIVWPAGRSEPAVGSTSGVPITALGASPDGGTWAVGRGDGSIEVWTSTDDGP